ncbi:MAG: DUF502 domain-containing protein [Halanaeroarchaeum sp.]
MSQSDSSRRADDRDGVWEFLRQAFVTGAAVMLPLVVTLWVVQFVVNFVSAQLDPVVQLVVATTPFESASPLAVKVVAFVTLVAGVLVVGAVAESQSAQTGMGALFDTVISRIPGLGSLYQGIDEMSSLLLDNDTDSFREVKLVEFPTEGSYALAFLTAHTPQVVEEPVGGEDMVTVFLPMAPNPVMGGFVLHLSQERIYDVDLSVEEGIQSIVTSGVATGAHPDDEVTQDMLDHVQRRLDDADIIAEFEDLESYAADATAKLERTARNSMPSSPVDGQPPSPEYADESIADRTTGSGRESASEDDSEERDSG